MSKKILVINPGSTSTKLAIYEDQTKIVQENFVHESSKIAEFKNLIDQVPFRTAIIDEFLNSNNISLQSLSAVVGRGGLVVGLKGGGYTVNDDLATALSSDKYSSPHASNLGGLIARSYAEKVSEITGNTIPSYIYDAVTGGELSEVASITGFKEITRTSACHLLNSHAMSVKYAQSIGKTYNDLQLIVAHLGGGISISAHTNGKLTDSIGDDEFHFSPERSGNTSLLKVLDLIYNNNISKAELKKMIRGSGGMFAHLGTNSCIEIEKMIEGGDKYAKLIYEAQAQQVAKSIGGLSVVQKGQTDAIILTGGIAHSKMLTSMITDYVNSIAKVVVLPGENEMEALAFGALRLINNEETPHTYKLPQ
ncbi:MAG: butyrate kinase [Eubacteriales bacterium]|nr:butyrate kinase [Eubacteriales bacterium]MDY3333193.1 butyrate kinase [Gallibacter sp.]